MSCTRCNSTGIDPRTSTKRSVDACKLCSKLAEVEYQSTKQKLRQLREAA